MATSVKFDKYLFTISKRNDSCLTMTAQTELQNSIFESGPVELKRIKVDTVVAALNKQNEKNLLSIFYIYISEGCLRGRQGRLDRQAAAERGRQI